MNPFHWCLVLSMLGFTSSWPQNGIYPIPNLAFSPAQEVNNLEPNTAPESRSYTNNGNYLEATLEEVQSILRSNPDLPRLTRGEILDLLDNITRQDMERLKSLNSNRNGKAVLLVMPYSPKNHGENMEDLYTKKPITQMIDSEPEEQKVTRRKKPTSKMKRVNYEAFGGSAKTDYRTTFSTTPQSETRPPSPRPPMTIKVTTYRPRTRPPRTRPSTTKTTSTARPFRRRRITTITTKKPTTELENEQYSDVKTDKFLPENAVRVTNPASYRFSRRTTTTTQNPSDLSFAESYLNNVYLKYPGKDDTDEITEKRVNHNKIHPNYQFDETDKSDEIGLADYNDFSKYQQGIADTFTQLIQKHQNYPNQQLEPDKISEIKLNPYDIHQKYQQQEFDKSTQTKLKPYNNYPTFQKATEKPAEVKLKPFNNYPEYHQDDTDKFTGTLPNFKNIHPKFQPQVINKPSVEVLKPFKHISSYPKDSADELAETNLSHNNLYPKYQQNVEGSAININNHKNEEDIPIESNHNTNFDTLYPKYKPYVDLFEEKTEQPLKSSPAFKPLGGNQLFINEDKDDTIKPATFKPLTEDFVLPEDLKYIVKDLELGPTLKRDSVLEAALRSATIFPRTVTPPTTTTEFEVTPMPAFEEMADNLSPDMKNLLMTFGLIPNPEEDKNKNEETVGYHPESAEEHPEAYAGFKPLPSDKSEPDTDMDDLLASFGLGRRADKKLRDDEKSRNQTDSIGAETRRIDNQISEPVTEITPRTGKTLKDNVKAGNQFDLSMIPESMMEIVKILGIAKSTTVVNNTETNKVLPPFKKLAGKIDRLDELIEKEQISAEDIKRINDLYTVIDNVVESRKNQSLHLESLPAGNTLSLTQLQEQNNTTHLTEKGYVDHSETILTTKSSISDIKNDLNSDKAQLNKFLALPNSKSDKNSSSETGKVNKGTLLSQNKIQENLKQSVDESKQIESWVAAELGYDKGNSNLSQKENQPLQDMLSEEEMLPVTESKENNSLSEHKTNSNITDFLLFNTAEINTIDPIEEAEEVYLPIDTEVEGSTTENNGTKSAKIQFAGVIVPDKNNKDKKKEKELVHVEDSRSSKSLRNSTLPLSDADISTKGLLAQESSDFNVISPSDEPKKIELALDTNFIGNNEEQVAEELPTTKDTLTSVVFNPTGQNIVQGEKEQLDKLMTLIKILRNINGSATEEDFKNIDLNTLKQFTEVLNKSQMLTLSEELADELDKPKEPEEIPDLSESPSEDAEAEAKPESQLLEESSPELPEEETETKTPPFRKLSSGVYYMMDWNSFLEVDNAKGKRVNLRFQPKVGDPSRFYSINND